LKILIEGLTPHADIWLGETLSSLIEAHNVVAGLEGDGRPLWLSFTLADDAAESETLGNLRSGESVAAAAELAGEAEAAALLFNCSQPEVMLKAVETALKVRERLGAGFEVGVYANAFPPQDKDAQANETLLPLRADLDPQGYLGWVRTWRQAGATIIGGCCGIGPEHIAELSAARRHGAI
jgi:S-methylmethionine-dependent homocysteine/selenocysteine methylase